MKICDEILSAKYDIVFKLLFGDERSIEQLTDFLKAVLDLPEDEYDEVVIVDPHLLPEYKGDKLGILDVKVKTKSKKVIDIEIQVDPSPAFKNRVVYYSAKMITEQVGSSEQYKNINRVISIIITDYVLIPGSKRYHNRFTLYDPESRSEFTDLIEVHVLELPKIPAEWDGTEKWDWMKFLSVDKKEELDMIAAKNPRVGRAVARLLELSQDEKARMLFESRQKLEWDIQSREQGARAEGIAEGIAVGEARGIDKGIDKRNLEVARDMIADGEPTEKIVRYSGFTREKVEGLRGAK